MTEIKHKPYILATIDHLRARKARPDIDRICRFMLKKFKVNFKETKADLKRCVDLEVVCKVDYKGNVSYRNAAKWKKELKNSLDNSKSVIMKSSSSAEHSLMNMVMAELIVIDPDCSERGVPPHKLMKAISLKENLGYSKKCLDSVLQKQLAIGGLVKLENGNFVLGVGDFDQESIDYSYRDIPVKMTSSNNSSSTSSPMRAKLKPGRKKGSTIIGVPYARVDLDAKTEMTVRVGERRKRAKKVFDPSDNNVPSKKKRGRPAGSLNKATLKKRSIDPPLLVSGEGESFERKSEWETARSGEEGDNETNIIAAETVEKATGGVCSVCRLHKTRDSGDAQRLVGCRDCSNKAHPSCLQGDGMLRLRPDNTWQCPHCKTCVVCIETNDAGVLTVCSVCADAYHALCHSPPIPERSKAWDQWECKNCQDTGQSGQNIDVSHADKVRGSDRTSKFSDGSDSLESGAGGTSGKSSVGSVDGIRSEPSERDRRIGPQESRSPRPQRTESEAPERRNGSRKNTERAKSSGLVGDRIRKKRDTASIFMDDYEYDRCYRTATSTKHSHDREEIAIDMSIPDATGWSHGDVYEYFSSYFPEEAHVFKEQEMDGKSLLMMRRSDVITSLGLPLGPALKLYRHVVKLQSRKDDFTMCWL